MPPARGAEGAPESPLASLTVSTSCYRYFGYPKWGQHHKAHGKLAVCSQGERQGKDTSNFCHLLWRVSSLISRVHVADSAVDGTTRVSFSVMPSPWASTLNKMVVNDVGI